MHRIILTFLCFLLPFLVSAQVTLEQANKKARKWYDKSTTYFAQQDFESVEEALTKALDAEPEFVDAMLRLADLYYMQKDFARSVTWFDRATALAPNHNLRTYFTYGYALWELDRFAEAGAAFKRYSEIPDLSDRKRKEINGILRNCQFAAKAVQHPVPFSPKNLGSQINTDKHEYLPTLTANDAHLFFTRRKGLQEDIFEAHWQDTAFGAAQPLPGSINTTAYGEGSSSISPDGKTLFFTADYGGNGQRGWDIYQSSRTKNGWTKPEMLPVPVNSLAYESQPSISADGRSLYFVSRRPGGLGGKDIWVSHLEEDCSWGEPVNLGPTINTFADEEVPFIHADGQTLYFGSTGHVGMGGSDLYMCRQLPDGTWSEPVNLGYPINTKANEGSLTVSTDGTTGYYTSDQMGGFGGFDLYRFQLHPAIQPNPVTWVDITIVDAETLQQLEADFALYNLNDTVLVANSGCQEYLKDQFLICLPAGIDYALNIERPGYLFHSERFTLTAKGDYAPVEKVIALQPIATGATLVLNNILFETDQSTLLPSSKIELNKVVTLLLRNPMMEIEIEGHTDNTGSDVYNMALSKERADAVASYLMQKGIDPSRLQTMGYGSTVPIATNDTEEGKALNRRTAITILHP